MFEQLGGVMNNHEIIGDEIIPLAHCYYLKGYQVRRILQQQESSLAKFELKHGELICPISGCKIISLGMSPVKNCHHMIYGYAQDFSDIKIALNYYGLRF